MRERPARLRAALTATQLEGLPPAAPAAVAQFEALHRITLPDEYRAFVLEVAEGILLDGEPHLYALRDVGTATGDHVDPARPFGYTLAEADAILAAIAAAGPGGPLA